MAFDEIKITIVSSDTQGDVQSELVQTNSDKNNTKKTLKPNKKSEKILGKSVLLNQTWNVAKSSIMDGIDTVAKRYSNLTENYRFDAIYGNTKTIISKGVGLVSTIAAGATIGGPVGGIIAGVGYGISTGIGMYKNYSQIRQGINANNYNMQFQQTRMNLIDNGKGTEN